MNKIDFSTKRVNLAIVVLSAIVMLIVLNFPFSANLLGDYTFHEESKNMALFLKGEVASDKVVITKAPGPILFYTPAYLLASSDATDEQLWVYGVLFTSIIVTISLLLIFRIAAAFFSKEVGLLSVLLFFVFPIHCYYSLGILAEIPAFFSLVLALYGWAIAFSEASKKRGWLLLTLGMWLLILNRPNALLLLGILLAVIAYSFFKKKSFYALYGKKLGFTFITVLLFSMGTLQMAKTINGNSSNQSQEFYFYYVAFQGRFQFRDEPTDWRFWESDNRPDSKDYQNWIRSGSELDAVMVKTKQSNIEVYRDFILSDMMAHPFITIRQILVRSFYGHVNIISKVQPSQFDLGPFKGTFGYWSFLLFVNSINLLVLLGLVLFLIRERNLIHYWLFWGVWIGLLVFHSLTYMEPRYIFPSRVALYVMSAAGLYRVHWIKTIINKISNYVFPMGYSNE
ncbi:hypothetical protein [Flavobacterium limnophilum]|uniref:hypothetical protein n=1 Tax=Flavobacterium limnophilum TaxID=3003262 RepID=UPI002482C467|nr:hypothetical protein [Flavobacterium limnophilum]